MATPSRKLCVAIDDSPHSERAIKYTLAKYVVGTATDDDHPTELELLTVTALPRLSATEYTQAYMRVPARQHIPKNQVDHLVEENRQKATRAANHLLEKYIKLALAAGVAVWAAKDTGYKYIAENMCVLFAKGRSALVDYRVPYRTWRVDTYSYVVVRTRLRTARGQRPSILVNELPDTFIKHEDSLALGREGVRVAGATGAHPHQGSYRTSTFGERGNSRACVD
eukprot:5506141-Pyramimonas_sp.AAC.2